MEPLTTGHCAVGDDDEVVVHNWDVSRGTGQALVTNPVVGQMVYDWAASIPLDDFRHHGAFGPEVPVSASAPIIDRLVGLLGRQP